ncbi:unnamed protein product [Vitrella brassicaformis CCMP3155]|uniref:FAS1 domain-containing protein n=1 Tax=Vitrella brassicaformis (strain CCMP3155) TaxID=1169540 RepID=A0A0G4H897_VITBC|nr:unnamed protein product [Vitrella brassicaformis CCMP3155]|eukprot:CEM40132.1 unnamed protein product [Vitrella brassicaformis CCMP3155]
MMFKILAVALLAVGLVNGAGEAGAAEAQVSGDGASAPAEAPPAGAAEPQQAGGEPPADAEATGDIVDIASETDDLSTLVTALEAAGLVETLQGAGPFTVFAPTNAAFEDVPNLDEILADPEELKDILLYHVVSGETASTDIPTTAKKVATVEGEEVDVLRDDTATPNTVTVTDAQGTTYDVVKADIKATNGVIHIINGVLIP